MKMPKRVFISVDRGTPWLLLSETSNWWFHLAGSEECQCSSVPTGKRETSVMSHIGNDAS